MESKQGMTVKDVLIDVNKVLNDISIPMAYIDSIGMPIARAINGINVCIRAIDEANAEQQEEADKPASEEEDKGEQDA